MKRKAQVTMEFMMVIAFILIAMMPLVYLFYGQSQDYTKQVSGDQIQQAAQRITDAAAKVYYLGKPSRMTIDVYFPEKLESAFIQGNDVVFQVKRNGIINDISSMSAVPINGTLPTGEGIHTVTVESRGAYVWLS